MKKNDRINLDSISNIREEIIDEVTDKKIELSKAPPRTASCASKRWIAIGSIAASLALFFGIFFVLIVPMMGTKVPVYQGMTIRTESAVSVSTEREHTGISLLSANYGRPAKLVPLGKSNGTPNGVANGHHKEDDDKLQNKIEDLVTIDVVADDEVRYYVKPGETFIIEIHIDNPDNFEIQSFTLNGQKYANYMFKEGSTMERLLLEVTAPATPGYVEYTIDAIKYIDGTEIKDVDMSSGDKSVKAGIAYPEAPSATVTAQSISTTSAELTINIADPHSLIGGNELTIYLSDGETIVTSKPLKVGDNTVTFDNLMISKTYEYGIVTAFDLVDGRDLHEEWLLTNIVTTAGAFSISNATATQGEITFDISRVDEFGAVTSISLYDAATDELVEAGGPELREFKNLLSGHTYNLYVDFTYTVNGEEVKDWVVIRGITTEAKTAPKVKLGNVSATDTAVSGTYTITDTDAICTAVTVDLYTGDTLVQSTDKTEFIFSDLDSYTDYELRVSYTYDLNDGTGAKTDTVTRAFKTSPTLIINSFKVLNTAAVEEGESIRLQINLQNPSRLIPTSVVINGKTYSCSTASFATVAFVDIVVKDQFEGGDTELTIESIQTAEIDKSRTYTTPIRSNNTANVFIKSRLEIMGVEVAVKDGDDYVQRDYVFPEDEVYAIVTLQNKAGYTVESINGATEAAGDLVKIDQEHYAVKISLPAQYSGSITYGIHEVVYNNGDGSQSVSGNVFTDSSMLYLQGTKEIRTAEDLLHMNEGYYYVLQNDIDLSGRNWTGGAFVGAFDGNGYAIENMTYIGRHHLASIGLFSNGSGSIQNLTLKAVNLVIDFGSFQGTNPTVGFVGGFIGSSGDVSFKNCSIGKDSIISASNALVGGFVGGNVSVTMENCTNNATVSGDFLTSGFVGSMGCDETKFINCINNGDIIGRGDNYKTVGFVFSAQKAEFVDCINAGGVPLSCGFSGRDATYTGCINIVTTSEPPFGDSDQTTNSYNLGDNVTVAELNSKSFYTETLGWDEEIWNLDDLDIENGKFPTLK